MPEMNFEYLAQRYRPREGSTRELLLFVAPASDIRAWAGVPRKAFDYQHGFQRTLDSSRVNDVAQYFRDDPTNISPTSIVLGFTDAIRIEKSPGGDSSKQRGCEMVRVFISLPDFTAMSLMDLADMTLNVLRQRIPAAVIAMIEADVEGAVSEAVELQDRDAVDKTFGIDAEENASDPVLADESEGRSYLADFFAQLLGYSRRLLAWPDEGQLREILYSLLKPAMIVDGQHRVFGAASAERNMLISICAIPASHWAENVYQFVVINQKAKPIKPAFLSSILATSLSADEIRKVYGRLKTSKIDVSRAEVMNCINTDPRSPFKDMIDFEVENSLGFLQFPGMARLAKDFQNIPNTHSILLDNKTWADVEGSWLDHFYAFWSGIRTYFETRDPRLWSKPSDGNPNNLLKIVTLQELQALVFDNWADGREKRFTTAESTQASSEAFWRDFPTSFFTDEWRQKGLQTSVGRRIVRDAITETRRNIGRKNWGHRRLGLFTG